MVNQMMVRLLTGMVAVVACWSIPLSADVSYRRARVVSCEPIVNRTYVSRPVERWDESVIVERRPQRDSATSTVVGGVVGGLLGNQIGKGSGRTVATVAGAVLGASVGRDMGESQQPHAVVEKRHYIEERGHTEERIEGYRVTYEYDGNLYTVKMAQRPGAYIDVRVETQVVPVMGG